MKQVGRTTDTRNGKIKDIVASTAGLDRGRYTDSGLLR